MPAHEGFLKKEKKEGRPAKAARGSADDDGVIEGRAAKREELILLAQVVAESRNHAGILFRTCLLPGAKGEEYFDNMKMAVTNYEKEVNGKQGHDKGRPCHHAFIAAVLTLRESLAAATEKYGVVEELSGFFDIPATLGRHIMEFKGYETRDRGHRFRFRLGEDCAEHIRKVTEFIIEHWKRCDGIETEGSAPPSKRERDLQARIRALR